LIVTAPLRQQIQQRKSMPANLDTAVDKHVAPGLMFLKQVSDASMDTAYGRSNRGFPQHGR
jgi:hypothetical protein